MNCYNHKLVVGLFLLVSVSAAQIVNDTLKQWYGTHTTGVFTQDVVYYSRMEYFKKDTLYAQKLHFPPLALPLHFIYLPQTAIKDSSRTDTITMLQKINPAPKTLKYRVFMKFGLGKYIIKDSVGPVTKYHQRFFKNNYTYGRPDTLLSDIHNYNYIFINDQIYQNQGVIGTPSKGVYYNRPRQLGYHSGIDLYDVYLTEPRDVKYYHSRSPFTRVYYLANTGDENNITFEVNRNILRFWNVGVYYQRINSNKIYGLRDRANNFLAANQDFKVYTSYKSNNERYHFLGNFTYFVAKTNEQGGMVLGSKTPSGLRIRDSATQTRLPENLNSGVPWLVSSTSRIEPYITSGSIFTRDRRIMYHFYQQFDILKSGRLSVFHEFDRRNQKFTYFDPFINAGRGRTSTVFDSLGRAIYRNLFKNRDTTYYNREFLAQFNTLGIKTTGSSWVLLGYIKHRDVYAANRLHVPQASQFYTPETWEHIFVSEPNADQSLRELYVGAEGVLRYKDSIQVHVKAEQMTGLQNRLPDSLTNRLFRYSGDYILSADMQYRAFRLGASRMVHSPLLQTLYMNHNNFFWVKPLKPTTVQEIYLSFKKTLGRQLYIRGSETYRSIYQFIYYDSLAIAQQEASPSGIQIFETSVQTNVRLGFFTMELLVKHAVNLGAQVIRFPEWYIHPKLYATYQPAKKKGSIVFMFGLDMHYRSAYYGYAYMPATGQFYVQDKFKLHEYLLMDLYINAKIKHALVFTRLNQINSLLGTQNQGTLLDRNGYWVSPGYPSSRLFLNIGFQWLLFD